MVNEQVLDILFANVRAPEQSWGDLKAQIAACNTGERKVHEMIAQFGAERSWRGSRISRICRGAGARRRARIPDGAYFFADYMDEDAVDGNPCRLT